MPYKVAVLTAAADASADKSGPLLRDILASQGGDFNIAKSSIVPDDKEQISNIVKEWCSSGQIDWIVTTGGTGFGVRDCTPEAIAPLIERHAPGLAHAMMAHSLTQTALAALARPVAGTIDKTFIVTLPGSSKAVKENMDVLLGNGLVLHALDLIAGGSGKTVHAGMGTGHASTSTQPTDSVQVHHHHHHHHEHVSQNHTHHVPIPRTLLSHDPTQPVSLRHRESRYPLLDLDAAIDLVIKHSRLLEIVEKPFSVALSGHVLAEDVYAPQDVPNTRTTNVDGYAVRASDEPGIYRVLSPLLVPRNKNVPNGYIYRINTGSPLPPNMDAVIMVEDTKLISSVESDGDDNGEEVEVETLAKMEVGENTRAPGSDVKKGALVLQKGLVLKSGGGELGTVAFVGQKKVLFLMASATLYPSIVQVQVIRKPVVAILSTGNEIADVSGIGPGTDGEDWTGIWDTNRPSLQALLQGMGYDVVDLGIVKDDIKSHVDALTEGLLSADIIITTGGTSMGSTDLLKPVIERYLNGTIRFGRVKVKPGKPTTFATLEHHGKTKSIFALPGNPASALVCFYIFVVPALRTMGGWPASERKLPTVTVTLQDPCPRDPRPEYHRVHVHATSDGLNAFSTGGQRSSRVASLSGANGLVYVPPGTKEDHAPLPTGSKARAVLIGELYN
ncbi:molybdenum cofactor biosynthesis protein [Dacryopinax primogenitus]|uniref:Molybdenum cofactor biosynthesis protein n=1 Tax=Dacryopinax primogenitus (strain DJM 731) TaxID=1858805 RepID=M5GFK2_DACPD|nr:molybdenum cofactor biosynthesis protein [Dacryopinax primogenitus]EJU06392.1 molybdenum cofactor biosynthesis protein [Dacryopinax primogenitus]